VVGVMSLILALSGAVLYGLSDFLGGLASRRTSPWAVAMVSAFAAAVLVLLVSFFFDGSPDATSLWWAVLAGVGNGFGTSFLYRGLSTGRMGVVAPISAVGAAVLPVAAGLVGGERPGQVVWIGILVALPGIWFVSREPDLADSPVRGGVGDGVLAGLGFGTLFAALGQIPESAGLLPLAFNQVVAGVVIIAVALVLRVAWLPRERPALVGLWCGALAAGATGAFLVATQHGELTITAVLASLYPAFTILLAASVLRERIHRTQGFGLALCGLAVVFVAVG
jgi:drug/metabolite transporter (DMT)-like permease